MKKNVTQKDKKTIGPQKNRFNPEEGPERRFKGGERPGNATICKKRYQQISITALGNINSTTNSNRILQTSETPVYTMTLQVGTTDFQNSSAVSTLTSLSLALLALVIVAIY